MKKNTIKEAIILTLQTQNKPLTSKEVLEIITEKGLYQFNTKNPQSVLNSEIRKHCEGLSLKTGKKDKCFVAHPNGSYSLIK